MELVTQYHLKWLIRYIVHILHLNTFLSLLQPQNFHAPGDYVMANLPFRISLNHPHIVHRRNSGDVKPDM
jgi:hypothetical protein